MPTPVRLNIPLEVLRECIPVLDENNHAYNHCRCINRKCSGFFESRSPQTQISPCEVEIRRVAGARTLSFITHVSYDDFHFPVTECLDVHVTGFQSTDHKSFGIFNCRLCNLPKHTSSNQNGNSDLSADIPEAKKRRRGRPKKVNGQVIFQNPSSYKEENIQTTLKRYRLKGTTLSEEIMNTEKESLEFAASYSSSETSIREAELEELSKTNDASRHNSFSDLSNESDCSANKQKIKMLKCSEVHENISANLGKTRPKFETQSDVNSNHFSSVNVSKGDDCGSHLSNNSSIDFSVSSLLTSKEPDKDKNDLKMEQKNGSREQKLTLNFTSVKAGDCESNELFKNKSIDQQNSKTYQDFESCRNRISKVKACKYCGKLFMNYFGVEKHVRKLHMQRKDVLDYLEQLKQIQKYKCPICGKSFDNKSVFKLHQINVHTSVKDGFPCERCGCKLKNLNSLRNHTRTIHKLSDEIHLCHLCPAKFKSKSTLHYHILEIHDKKSDIKCDICSKTFARQNQLNRHMVSHGTDPSKRLWCQKCGKGFWFNYNLNRHIKIVHGPHEEKFHCSYCGKGFNLKSGMVTHVQQVHFNIYPYQCPEEVCKAGFCREKLLVDHIQQQHPEMEYVVQKKSHNRYKYWKTSEDLFYCSHCCDSFCYKAKLVEHMHSVHSNIFPFKCEICSQGFLEKSYLLYHQQKAHGIELRDKLRDKNSKEQNTPLKNTESVERKISNFKETSKSLLLKKIKLFNRGEEKSKTLSMIDTDASFQEIQNNITVDVQKTNNGIALTIPETDKSTILKAMKTNHNLSLENKDAAPVIKVKNQETLVDIEIHIIVDKF